MDIETVIATARRRKLPKKPINFSTPVKVVDDFRERCKELEIEPSDVLNALVSEFTYEHLLSPDQKTAMRAAILEDARA